MPKSKKALFAGKRGFTGKRRQIDPDNTAEYIDAPQLRRRYGGRSEMWLTRIMEADPEFPKPMVVNRLRFFALLTLLPGNANARRATPLKKL